MVNKKLYIFFYTIIFLFLFPIFPHASELTFLYDCAEKTDMHVDNYGSIAIYASNQQDMERVKNILNTMPKQIVKGFEGIDGKIVITDKEYIQLLYYEENGLFYKSQSAAFGKMFNKQSLWGGNTGKEGMQLFCHLFYLTICWRHRFSTNSGISLIHNIKYPQNWTEKISMLLHIFRTSFPPAIIQGTLRTMHRKHLQKAFFYGKNVRKKCRKNAKQFITSSSFSINKRPRTFLHTTGKVLFL